MNKKKKFKVKCRVCEGDMWEKLGATNNVLNGYAISLLNVPFFHCENCDGVGYRKMLCIPDILREAYENHFNVILFDSEDIPSICSYLLE